VKSVLNWQQKAEISNVSNVRLAQSFHSRRILYDPAVQEKCSFCVQICLISSAVDVATKATMKCGTCSNCCYQRTTRLYRSSVHGVTHLKPSFLKKLLRFDYGHRGPTEHYDMHVYIRANDRRFEHKL